MKKNFKKIVAAVLTGVTVISSLSLTAFAEEETTTVPTYSGQAAFDPAGEYAASICVQVDGSWAFRNAYNELTYGGASDYEYKNQLSCVQNNVEKPLDGTFTDATITGNGTYTVTLENPEFNTDENDATAFNIIALSTNIPYSALDTVKFTDVTYTVNDSAVTTYTYPEGIVDPDQTKNSENDLAAYLIMVGCNKWNTEECVDANTALAGEDAWPGTVNKISITFTVSGFTNDAETTAAETTTAATTAATTEASDDSDSGLPTAAYIAIGVGAVVVVGAVAVVAVNASKKKKA